MLRSLKEDTRDASHNIMACRLARGSSILEEANDNGEPPAAQRILHILRQQNARDTMIVVTRWYGGMKLGPERFRIIDECAREALNKLNLF